MKPVYVAYSLILITCYITLTVFANPLTVDRIQRRRISPAFSGRSSTLLYRAQQGVPSAASSDGSGKPLPGTLILKNLQNGSGGLDRKTVFHNWYYLHRNDQRIGETGAETFQHKTAECSGLLKCAPSSKMNRRSTGALSSEDLSERSASQEDEKNISAQVILGPSPPSESLAGKIARSGSVLVPIARNEMSSSPRHTAVLSEEEKKTASVEVAAIEAEDRELQEAASRQNSTHEEAEEVDWNARGNVSTRPERRTPSSDSSSAQTTIAEVEEEEWRTSASPEKALQNITKQERHLNSASLDRTAPKNFDDEARRLNRTRRGTSDMLNSERHSYYTSSETCRQKRRVTVVRIRGCIPRRVLNSSCEGTCHSRSVPQWDTEKQELIHVAYCTCCKPYQLSYRRVTVRCPRRPKNVTFFIGIATQCACRPCSDGNPRAVQPYDY